MALGEGNIEQHTPIVAFAHKETDDGDEAKLKISSRATRKLTEKGVDLSIVMETASQHVDGDGGGHDIAAGATIPADRRNEFIEKADEIITSQLNS